MWPRSDTRHTSRLRNIWWFPPAIGWGMVVSVSSSLHDRGRDRPSHQSHTFDSQGCEAQYHFVSRSPDQDLKLAEWTGFGWLRRFPAANSLGVAGCWYWYQPYAKCWNALRCVPWGLGDGTGWGGVPTTPRHFPEYHVVNFRVSFRHEIVTCTPDGCSYCDGEHQLR